MNFGAVPGASLRSGFALPPRCPENGGLSVNRQRLPLYKSKRCLDQASRLSHRRITRHSYLLIHIVRSLPLLHYRLAALATTVKYDRVAALCDAEILPRAARTRSGRRVRPYQSLHHTAKVVAAINLCAELPLLDTSRVIADCHFFRSVGWMTRNKCPPSMMCNVASRMRNARMRVGEGIVLAVQD
jgi:hypothetical protein